ncbi:XIAP-associated factor 1 [Acanthochromis polyacanthus]|uniref:XIAP-associated factor 1 n=1 Tax=Acanthochromis polyacanthus TaxID=80966 RepID=UPI0022345A3F|nr:XIAP-associated factor 1 [Acanthochromis polyacanthus]
MDSKEATRTCGQCHKEVAEANFALHETHCSRFLCLCPDCDEAVPRDQLAEHKEEQHTLVRCTKCSKKMERCQLADHEADECEERLQSCVFCDLELPWKELDQHCLVCGSRTELCRDCGRYVKLRDQPEHQMTCSAADGDSSPPLANSGAPSTKVEIVSCRRCMGSFPAEELEEHQLKCAGATRSDDEEAEEKDSEDEEDEEDVSGLGAAAQLSSTFRARLSDRPSQARWDNEADPHQISTCPHCHLALPLITLRWHETKCQIHILLK